MDAQPDRPYHALSTIPDIDQRILDGIAAGRSLRSIADQYGVHDTAVLRRAQKHEQYREMREIGSELRMDEREFELECARDNVSVTRADRLLGHARWLAERSCPDRWGAKPSGGNVNVQVILRSPSDPEAAQVVIAAEQQNV
jgi:transposase-like protein